MSFGGRGSPDDQTRLGSFELPPELAPLAARYEFLSECGRGGMGIVYKARDRQTGDMLAVKVLKPSITNNADLIERFKNELLLARKVTHKNVCRVYDLNDYGGVMAISMEYVVGETLHDVLGRRAGVSIRYGVRLIHQIMSGLAEAHLQGVVHRDLKPSNIHVSPDGSVKVMDFGIARSVDSHQTGTGLIVGTPAYMSPEQAEGRPPDARSDIYALGLVMYEIFCGEPVFTADSTTAMVAKHLNEPPRSPHSIEPDLPRRMTRAILRCLEKDPKDRFQSIGELAAALMDEPRQPATTDPGATEFLWPPALIRWGSGDWVLLVAAIAAVAIYLPVFGRTNLAPRTQVTFDHSVLRRIVQEHLQRLHLPPRAELSWHIDTDTGSYTYVADTQGASTARLLANEPVPFMWWHMMLDGESSVAVNNRGEFLTYQRPVASSDVKAPPLEEARATAERALVEAWSPALASLTVERTTAGQQSHSFGWVNATGVDGLQERLAVTVDGNGVQSLVKSYQVPPTYRARNISWGDPVSIALGLLAVAIGIRYRKRVNLAARWRVVFGVITFATAASFVWVFWSLARVTDYLIVSAGFGLIAAIVWILGSAAIECLLARTKPGAFSSLMVLVSRQFRSSPVGLAVLRGTLAGLVVLGIDVVGVWLVTTSSPGGRLDTVSIFWVAQAFSKGWPVGAFVSLAAMQALEIGMLVAFVVGVVERVTAPGWLRAGIATALLTASGIHMGMARVQPYYWMLAVLAIDYLGLVLVFRRFDLLTIVVASFTMAFVWGVHPLLVLLQPIGAAWPITALLIWAAVIAAAVVFAFERKFSRAFTRLAGSLE